MPSSSSSPWSEDTTTPSTSKTTPLPEEAQPEPEPEHSDLFTKESVAAHIEWIVRGCTSSINNRTFEQNPTWSYISSSFEVSHDTGNRPPTSSKKELLEGFKAVTSAFPDFQLEIFSVTTEVDLLRGVGQVFANAQETGGPEVTAGFVSRKHIAVFDFVRERGSGRWVAVREATMLGLGVDQMLL